MATWYVRPDASHGGTNDGTSYANAFQGWSSIIWGAASGVRGSTNDTLYVCGTFSLSTGISIGAHGGATPTQIATIRGDYNIDPGTLKFTSSAFLTFSRSYTTLTNLTLLGETTSVIFITGTLTNLTFNSLTISGIFPLTIINQTALSFSGAGSFTNVNITNNNINNIGGTTGAGGRGVALLVSSASITHQNFNVKNNIFTDLMDCAVRFSIESAAVDTSQFININISNNTLTRCKGGIMCRAGAPDIVTPTFLYSSKLTIKNNLHLNCGNIAGTLGQFGGLNVQGFSSVFIEKNTYKQCYVIGGAIEVLKAKETQINYNIILSPRSGSPSSQFQNGFPIDGNGIFIDNLCSFVYARGNKIDDCINTGISNSGTGISFWDCNNSVFEANLITNCYRGVSYGKTTETNNYVRNNTFVNCVIGCIKHGTETLTGNITVTQNIFLNCITGFEIGANPGITEDYNYVYNSTTPYSGITIGSNSSLTNPKLSSTYVPSLTSPVYGASVVQTAIKDNNSVLYKTPCSIGAYEFVEERAVR